MSLAETVRQRDGDDVGKRYRVRVFSSEIAVECCATLSKICLWVGVQQGGRVGRADTFVWCARRDSGTAVGQWRI